MGDLPTRTTCPYCGVGCGVLASQSRDGSIAVAGDPEHPANFGRLCSKGTALGETLSLDGRLLHPLIDGKPARWELALDLVAQRFTECIAAHGPNSVAFYVSGQLLTEDYYVANKLMKGFIGSANIDTNSRLCMASSVAGHKRAFGSDTVPGTYEDLEQASLVVLVGSNLAWCHPVLFQRLAEARETRGTKVVVIDPRRTATCEIADFHLQLAPGSDVALFNGLLTHIDGASAIDTRYVSSHTSGLKEALRTARGLSTADIARVTGISRLDLFRFYDLFIATERVVTVYSQGVNQSTAGTDKVNAIINCHLATGRIGRPGMGPFSVTGQPNAMGGREVGGLANMLAAHMDLDNPEHRTRVQGFWKSPRIAYKPGLKAVDMFRAVGDGRIKAIWIMATNPVDSMPEADSVRAALEACPFVVVSDVSRHTDTTACADVLLPSLAWGEKDGTVTNSERCISRQRGFLPPPGEARADWWQLAEIGRRMGYAHAFAWSSASEIFAEHARLSALENGGSRDFDIGGFAAIDPSSYDNLAPTSWPKRTKDKDETTRFFANGSFFTPDRHGRFIPTPFRATCSTTEDLPLTLNTGRIRDQWHTMTRTAKAARLMTHTAEPFVEVHPTDAARFGLRPAGLGYVRSAQGSAVLRVLITDRQRPGSLFVPMHWTDQLASAARIDAVVNAAVDPVSGQPGLKQTAVTIAPFEAAFHALVIVRERPNLPIAADYWALAPLAQGWRLEIARRQPPEDVPAFLQSLVGTSGDRTTAAEHLNVTDTQAGLYRCALYAGTRLMGALWAGPDPVAASRSWASGLIGADWSEPADRWRILAGRPGGDVKDRGPIVCACFEVGRNEIVEAILGGHTSVAEVGARVKAGTNCGSCRAEIGRLIHAHTLAKAG